MRIRRAAILVVVASCSVGDIDYTGKACPCPAAWICADGTCARAGQQSGDAGAIRVKDLRAAWATPNSIRWEWEIEGDRDAFGSMELAVTSPRADAAGVATRTSASSPELGRMYLATRGGSEIPVTATLTEGHDPDTQYRAVLTAYDSAGKKSVTNEALTTTEVALSRRIVLFSEDRPRGYPLPSTLEIAAGCGAAGTNGCIRYHTADDPERSCTTFGCTQNLRWQSIDATTTEIDEGLFRSRAYFELYVRSTGTTVSYYSLLWLFTNPPPGGCAPPESEGCRFRLVPWTFRPSDTYRRIQVPLRVLENSAGALLSHADLARGLSGFNVGAAWGANDVVELDELAIWY
ncbi:MAG: hypothetical protein KF819_26685 [Labilithrix sp.]|nr:hypothetical protein [Labilithrix sp.]